MTHIAICDDEQIERNYLSGLVKNWAINRDISISINDFSSAEGFLFSSEDKAFDILLLDIEMEGMDGVTLAKKIRLSNKEIQIIFITGYMEYIADGYDVEALHYLLKPVSEEKLATILDRAISKLASNEKALFINQSGENIRIPLGEIRYLEVFHNYVTIHAADSYKVKKTLGALEKDLDSRFFRAGRSYIVNLRFVRKSTKSEVHLADGTVIPMSRGLYAALNRAIIEHT